MENTSTHFHRSAIELVGHFRAVVEILHVDNKFEASSKFISINGPTLRLHIPGKVYANANFPQIYRTLLPFKYLQDVFIIAISNSFYCLFENCN
jgi:hypothetical protein